MSLKVIGAGLGRTGTDSMREALNMIGMGPTHHMHEVIGKSGEQELWKVAIRTGAADWDRLLGGYHSCVDWPSAHFWRELSEAMPDAHVLLTWRSPESWWRSMEKTILKVLEQSDSQDGIGHAISDAKFDGRIADREHAIAVYNAHVEEVRTAIPDDRLIIHQLGDGWGQLCSRLGVEEPPEPYPHRNKEVSFFDKLEGDYKP